MYIRSELCGIRKPARQVEHQEMPQLDIQVRERVVTL